MLTRKCTEDSRVLSHPILRNFRAMGMGAEVPPFLRWEGTVLNTHMGKGECELAVKEVWALKGEWT